MSGSTSAILPSSERCRFSIDRGGTFTDVYAEVPSTNGKPAYRVLKLLSVDPANYPDAPREAIRRILEEVTGESHPADKPLDTRRIEWIRMGTTVATNALLERKGERTAFVTTKGFKDLLHIGNQSRAKIFDLEIARPDNVYEQVIEVDERVIVDTVKEGGGVWRDEEWEAIYPTKTGVTGEKVTILQKPNLELLKTQLEVVKAAGILSLAVSLAHSYTFPDHEQMVGELARSLGFTHISLSSSLMPMVKLVPRSYTACADAYLTPCIHQYLTQFRKGFDADMEKNTRVWFMQSDGGLVPVDKFSGFRAVLSGPAGGVVGYAQVTPITENSGEEADETTVTSNSRAKTVEEGFAQEAVIGFDMGGTSTDVSRFSGNYEHVFENTTAGITIQAPQLDINTIAAGGGSMLFFKNGLFVVGPESAGAHPGPACYRKGGPLTITDANVFLKRLLPEYFPKIFGHTQDQPLDVEASQKKFAEMTEEINAYFRDVAKTPNKQMTAEEVALGFVQVANEAMCRPIRALTQSKGYDITRHTLSVFGGAGGQHAAAIAQNLGIRSIFLHRFSGILSAYGLGLADVVQEKQEPCTKELLSKNMKFVLERLDVLKKDASAELAKYGFTDSSFSSTSDDPFSGKVVCEVYLNLRYAGTDTSVMTTLPNKPPAAVAAEAAIELEEAEEKAAAATTSGKKGSAKKKGGAAASSASKKKKGAAAADHSEEGDLAAAYLGVFVARYQREYGFTLQRPVIIDDIRVRAIGHSEGVVRVPIRDKASVTPTPKKFVKTFFDNHGANSQTADMSDTSHSSASTSHSTGKFLETGVYVLSELHAEDKIVGPAMIIDNTSTTLIEPGCHASINPYGDIELVVGESASNAAKVGLELNNIQLSIFSHRFMSIAEQMGRTLQRCAISTNVKERLDFSCALFAPDGGLVANAPHLPVHLGAMQEAVRFQIRHRGDDWQEGDVLVSNHPQAGGSHLPDITVITPVFAGGKKVFFVASRGHHSDIGGISPGSMPPFSKNLFQEGARIISHKLVTKESGFDEAGITELLNAPGEYKTGPDEPACSATRNLKDNLSDLKAQVAANQKGIQLMGELIKQYSLEVVQKYMHYIQANAEEAVREMLTEISLKRNLKEVDTLYAVDHMDDGSSIKLALTIDRRDGTAIFDFHGTSPEVFSNTNAPPAVTYSAIIYCLRCQVKRDIPLNQGCLNPIKILIPKGTFLNPSHDAAVVGGNVLTSQRVTDVVLRAFGACAASQGCMNNLTFGTDGEHSFGYYETIAGGAGAGPTWEGQSGVHTHMTNTRITDPEVLERRYPVLLREFGLRAGSGGKGFHNGGDGIIREIEFLRPMNVGILSERRCYRPYGLDGGQPGKSGKNFMVVRDKIPLNAANGAEEKKEAPAPTSGRKGRGKATAAAAVSSSSYEPVQYVSRLISLGGKNTYKALAHDRIRIVTPGGGGFGKSTETDADVEMEEVDLPESTRPVVTDGSSSSGPSSLKRKLENAVEQEEARKKQIVELRTQGSVAAYQSLQEQA